MAAPDTDNTGKLISDRSGLNPSTGNMEGRQLANEKLL
jgi:hypothetical protein